MRSRITIDLDDQNRPVIKIDYAASDDIRDKLVKRFLEGFGGSSNWASFQFHNPINVEYPNSTAFIRPICGYSLPEEAAEMIPEARIHLASRIESEQLRKVDDPRQEFERFLKDKEAEKTPSPISQ